MGALDCLPQVPALPTAVLGVGSGSEVPGEEGQGNSWLDGGGEEESHLERVIHLSETQIPGL